MITITVLVAVCLIVLELAKPARVYEEKMKKLSYFTNGVIFVFNNIITFFLNISIVYIFVSDHTYSYFSYLDSAVALILGIIILDFSIYIWHRLNHKISFLWNFHKCHHSEIYLNTTSAVRFHIGELFRSLLFKTILLVITGIPYFVFVFYEALITIFALFHHANIALPDKAQDCVSRILITPAIHRVHHSEVRKEHDTNFGVIFSWWDHIFRTLHTTTPKKIGLSYGGEKNFYTFLKFPLEKQKKQSKRQK